jgi:hypothetical protein
MALPKCYTLSYNKKLALAINYLCYMVNHESGLTNSDASEDGGSSTTKEKSSKSKRIVRAPIALPSRQPAAEKPLVSFEPKQEFVNDKPRVESDPKADDETVSDTEIDTPTAEEEQQTNQQIAAEHKTALEQTDEQTQIETQVAVEFLEDVEHGVDPEVAFSQRAAELGMTEDEIAAALEDEPGEETDSDKAPEAVVFNAAESDDEEGEIDLSSSRSRSASPPPPPTPPTPPTGTGFGSGSGGSTPPPSAPVPAPVSARPVPTPNVLPAPTAVANTLPPAAETYYRRRSSAGELLVVGIVGYLIGRRRGRIKTEKRLLPVQKKLEKRVAQLEQNITHKEKLLIAAKARQNAERPMTAVKLEATPVSRQESTRPAIERTQPGRQETRLGMEKPLRAEHLGKMIIKAEAPRTRIERPNNIRQAFQAEEVKTMQRGELLELSEKIIVEGASLRKIYESRLIGEKQLRHLVSEYLQGKDIRNDLRREMVEHEIDFERDPILRDRVRSQMGGDGGSGGLGALLAKAGVVDSTDDTSLKRQVEKENARRAAEEKRQKRQRVVADSAMVTAVVVLAITVMVLVLGR